MAHKFLPAERMKKDYPTLAQMQAEQAHKVIPEEYQEPILTALHHFPELKETSIEFKFTDKTDLPHHTRPALASLLLPAGKRHYSVELLTLAEGPAEKALFKNLPFEAQIAVIAHELGHILQYEERRSGAALKKSIQNEDAERTSGREADICVIEHGLGFELYTYAVYLRSIKEYLDLRPDMDRNHLNPSEILEALPPDQLQSTPRF